MEKVLTVTYNHYLKKYARKLRKQGTYAEVLLWSILKKRQIKGYKFTRQKPINKYIVDFYCPKLHLAIEIDGISHDSKINEDLIRQKEIEKQKIYFLRFPDDTVKENLQGVFEMIVNWINQYEAMNGIVNNNPVNIEW